MPLAWFPGSAKAGCGARFQRATPARWKRAPLVPDSAVPVPIRAERLPLFLDCVVRKGDAALLVELVPVASPLELMWPEPIAFIFTRREIPENRPGVPSNLRITVYALTAHNIEDREGEPFQRDSVKLSR
jgi:hypothetical protein